ncbi:MAG: hypothetical protein J0H88_17450 [Sphingomonadales bacterium]|nr:hypothetical protein [Sphingomonadales bacterium]
MKKILAALMLASVAVPAAAQDFPGALIAEFYMSEFSIPKGWELSYKGAERGVQVFIMDRDLDAHPQTSFLQPINQMQRLMCGDDELKQMVADGLVVRVDTRDKRNGKKSLVEGPTLTRC